jgi:hypothetical protein
VEELFAFTMPFSVANVELTLVAASEVAEGAAHDTVVKLISLP